MNGQHRGDVEVDDLFGDAANLGEAVTINLPLHSIPVEGLPKYIDDQHRSSTEQTRLAWSRLGCLASLSSDSLSVMVRHLTLSASERRWDLSNEHLIDLSANGEKRHPILQLEWSQTGADLALADEAGRVTIVNASVMAVNESAMVRPATLDREDELGQVLAMYWLSAGRNYATYVHASKKDQDKWAYMASKREPLGPFWPRAVFVITRRGSAILHYQRPDGRWAIVTSSLTSLTSPGSHLTHAAIAPAQDKKLLITAQNASRQLLVFAATVDMPDQRQDPQLTSSPKISIENIRPSVPYLRPRDASNQNDDESILFDAGSHFLSHLVIVPTSDIEKAAQLPPTLLAFYTPVINSMGMVDESQLSMTTVKRWDIVSAERKIHPNFDSIQPKGGAGGLIRRTDLQRLDDVHLHQIITTVQKIDGGEQLALGGADGSLALYDPHSLAPLYLSTDTTKVTSMAQSGFTFPSYSRGLNLVVSPNACVLASLTTDGKIQLTHVEHPGGLNYASTDPTTIEAAIEAIILSFARTSYAGLSWNDTLLLVTRHLDPVHYPQLIEATFKALLSDKDFITSSDSVGAVGKPIAGRILSLQASLGHNPSSGQRSDASMLSWLTINIRFCFNHFMHVLTSLSQGRGAEWKDPEVCEIVCNNIRWTLDLCKHLVDDLFEMSDQSNHSPPHPDKAPQPQPQPPSGATTTTTTSSPSSSLTTTKLLLLSAWPRFYLKRIVRILRGFVVRATPDPNAALATDTIPAFTRMAAVVKASPLKMEPLEQLLVGIDKTIQHFYDLNGMTEGDVADAERFLLSRGQVPPVLRDVVPRILVTVLPITRGMIDRLALYLEDFSWLGLRGDRRSEVFRRDFVVEVHRKMVLRREGLARVKRCVRCGSVSVELGRVRHWPQYLLVQLQRCVCEDAFAVVGSDDG